MQDDNTVESHQEPEEVASVSVVGVRFRACGKIYTFTVDNLELPLGKSVVVESDIGVNLAYVAVPVKIIQKPADRMKKVVRVATDKDIETMENNRALEKEARNTCAAKAKEYGLQMKVVSTDATLDRKRLTFYFTSDGRIDFRELVRELASKFKTRIEMRQIGVRDEVKILGGIGICGRQTCCNLFLTSFAPVTIRMAKQQSLSINQSKLSGICGRLMCCLSYEHGQKVPSPVRRSKKDDKPAQVEVREAEVTAKKQPEKKIEDKPQRRLSYASPKLIEKQEGSQTEPATTEPDGQTVKRKRRRRRSSRGPLPPEAGAALKTTAAAPSRPNQETKEGGRPRRRRRPGRNPNDTGKQPEN
ncbi:MAG: stage 0 sporulation protein [Nitrospira sp.]|nr:stage 0 sporulation protein [bacterium]MBL7048445.1 stage 0 sporulation protein [Nitrospira sp.]